MGFRHSDDLRFPSGQASSLFVLPKLPKIFKKLETNTIWDKSDTLKFWYVP
jgi:hypothetical protein